MAIRQNRPLEPKGWHAEGEDTLNHGLGAPLDDGFVQHREDAFTGDEHPAHAIGLAHAQMPILHQPLERAQANAERFGGFLPGVHCSGLDSGFE